MELRIRNVQNSLVIFQLRFSLLANGFYIKHVFNRQNTRIHAHIEFYTDLLAKHEQKHAQQELATRVCGLYVLSYSIVPNV